MSLYDDLIAAGLPVVSAGTNQATFSRALDEQETELYHDILDPSRPIRRAEHQQDLSQLKSEYLATLQQLQQIADAQAPTNAQVIAAVKFIARTLRLILKFIARQYI